tara:strand:- start:515 stop:943 length:429 start_codon:yes stop_codon:yes gene_type:complete
MKILIFGLPGSGKTTLSKELAYRFNFPHFNADVMREWYGDFDFSRVGRMRQASRMHNIDYGILDFVCPIDMMRGGDYKIWMDTIKESRFDDTNEVFEIPDEYDLRITEWIDLNQLRNSLEDSNPGIKGIQSYLREHLPKLVK